MVVIGFVNDQYSFSEPNPGTNSQTEEVCIEIKTGSIAVPLSIMPSWTAGSATGNCIDLSTYSQSHRMLKSNFSTFFCNTQRIQIILNPLVGLT